MKKRLMILFLGIVMVLSGCQWTLARSESTDARVVSSIDIVCEPEDTDLVRHYTQPEKVKAVLSYLRELEPSNVLDGDPDECSGCRYRITMNYIDGFSRTYIQIANQYFQEEGQIWEQLDLEQGKGLKSLLHTYSTD